MNHMMKLKIWKKEMETLDPEGYSEAKGAQKRRADYYYDSKHNIKEIKSLFNPKEYKGARPMYDDKQIIKLLTKEL